MKSPCLFLLSLVLCACAAPKKKGPTAPVGPHLVGTVALIDTSGGFVLVDVGTYYLPGTGKTLKCYSGGKETAELSSTPERKIPFITADIVKGAPNLGDQVFE